MSMGRYLRASGGLLVHGVLLLVVSAYLALLGAGWPNLVTLWLIWLGAVGAYYGWRYVALRAYYRELDGTLAGLERPYLLGSVGAAPVRAELEPLWEALVRVSSSVAGEAARLEREGKEHREYVEAWVHEVKGPILAARLQAEGSGEVELVQELDRIDQLVEQALYFARASSVEQDYFVRETVLAEPVRSVLRRHSRLFISNQVSVVLEAGLELTAFTDRKWLEFILGQVLTNAVKYKRAEGAAVRIWAGAEGDGVRLCIEENGIGIPAADLGRVFEKGFTGANGRRYERSTGVGLYLARKLCHALGHGISVESVEGEFTRVSLFFPKGRLLRP